MGQDYDELFAKHSIQLKMLTPSQVMSCREVMTELESAGVVKPLAVVAVDQGAITRADAGRLIEAINKKFPGKHPPLAGAPAPAPAPAPKAPSRSTGPAAAAPAPSRAARSAPAARRPAPAPAAPAKGNPKLLLIGGGIAAVVAIAVVAGFAFGGGSGKKEHGAESKKAEVARIDSSKVDPPKEDVRPRAPEPSSPAARTEPKPEPKPAPPPPPPPPPAPVDAQAEAKKAFQERLAERKKEAQARLDEVKKELAQERKEADEIADATRKRLASRKVTLTLTSGETYKDATLQSFNFYGADLAANGKSFRITWDTVKDASLVAAADIMFDAARAADLFERGRFFVARRKWNEAKSSFAAAAKLGQGFESRVLEFSEVLDRLASGQGGFRGSARRVGQNAVHLDWTFADARQLEDFSAGLKLDGRAAVLESAAKANVFFHGSTSSGSGETPLAFVGEVSAEMHLSSDGPVTFTLFPGATLGFELVFGPAGAALFRINPSAPEKDRRKQIAASDKVKLSPGKTVEVKVIAKYPRFRLTVDKAEALAAEDGPSSATADKPKGPFGFGIEKGKLRIEAPMALEGECDQGELDRRINDTEVMVRRALDPDLEQIERFRTRRKAMYLLGETRDLSLSADDEYFAFRIKGFDNITKYGELKKRLGAYDDTQTAEMWRSEMDALIGKHPDVPSLYHVRALFRHEHQDFAGALSDVKKAIELHPEFHEALTLQSEILLEQQEPEAALAAARAAVDARPDYVQGYVMRARCVYATAPTSSAFLEDLDIARKLDPQDSEAVTVQRMLKYQRLGPRELGCRFDYETAHYKVTSDISPEASKRFGENLEAAFRHYSDSFKGAAPRDNPRKPRVAVFQVAENYYTYFELLSEDRGEHTAGVFRPGLNELVLFESGDDDYTNHVLYHEAVHQFMTLLTSRTPPFWYNEGIAEYMGSIKVKDGKVLGKGLVLYSRLPLIKLAVEVKADVPFEKIMNQTPREFYSGNIGLNYAQAWSMIHFFYEYEKGKYRSLIEAYFEALRAGRTPRDSYDSVFKDKAESLQKEWREFTRSLK